MPPILCDSLAPRLEWIASQAHTRTLEGLGLHGRRENIADREENGGDAKIMMLRHIEFLLMMVICDDICSIFTF